MSTSTAPTTSEEIQDFGGGKYGIGGAVNDYWQRLRGGDVGSLPAVLGAVVLVVVFTALRPDTFTKALNFANLIQQGAAVTVIAMGLVFVLLLGEIDLAAGFTAGTCGAVMGVMIKNHGWPWWAAIVAALVTGVVIGGAHGPARVTARHPVLRRHAGLLPQPAGRDARDHRRGRHGHDPGQEDPRDHEQQPADLARLDALRRRHRRVRLADVLPPSPGAGDRRRALVAVRGGPEGRWRGRPAGGRHVLPEHRAEQQPVDRLDQGCPRGGRPPGHPRRHPVLPAEPDRLRPPRLRRGRQRGGRAPRRYRCAQHQADLLHHLFGARRHGRHPVRQPQQLDLAVDRWRHRPAPGGRRGGHRRDEPVRRQGTRHRRGHRRLRRRRDPERHEPDGCLRVVRLHLHRPGAAPRGQRRRACRAAEV